MFISRWVFIFVLLLNCKAQAAIEYDKKQHFVASAAISTTLHAGFYLAGLTGFKPYLYSFLLTFSVGFGKELTDKKIDSQDLVADALGALTVPVVLVTF